MEIITIKKIFSKPKIELMITIYFVSRLAKNVLSISDNIEEAIAKIKKPIKKAVLLRIGSKAGDHKFSPNRKIAVTNIEARQFIVRQKLIKLLLSSPYPIRNRIIDMPNPNSEIKAISPIEEMATEDSPTASVEYNLVEAIIKMKPSIDVLNEPTIRYEAFLKSDFEKKVFNNIFIFINLFQHII